MWVPSHTGIAGNKKAEKNAYPATKYILNTTFK